MSRGDAARGYWWWLRSMQGRVAQNKNELAVVAELQKAVQAFRVAFCSWPSCGSGRSRRQNGVGSSPSQVAAVPVAAALWPLHLRLQHRRHCLTACGV